MTDNRFNHWWRLLGLGLGAADTRLRFPFTPAASGSWMASARGDDGCFGAIYRSG
jgi:hypothetical protein